MMDKRERERQIQEHLDALARLQAQAEPAEQWPPKGYYWMFHILVGMALGCIGAVLALMLNIFGSLAVGQHPLELIRVYLTFPMGEKALSAESGSVLFVGCCLYLITGGLYGIIFHVYLSLWHAEASFLKRMVVGSILGLVLWLVNFYGVLAWLQPTLLGGNWIVARVPVFVAAGTHVVFAGSIAFLEHWGRFEPGSFDSVSNASPVTPASTGEV